MPTQSDFPGEFVGKTIEEDLTRLLTPSGMGADAAESSTVIRTQSLSPTPFC
jgi:hypothetical protein